MAGIYLDHNASTPLLPAAWEAMRPFLTAVHGNPASAHAFGRKARQALEDARERVAACLGAHPDEVIFTSGATEANNLALFGLGGDAPGSLVASPLEHPSVRAPLDQLARRGFVLDLLPATPDGTVRPADLRCRPDTRLVSVMLANHETGAILPVAELVQALDGQAPFHCDAVQAAGKVAIHFHTLGVTTLAISAHKFHGPQGVGALLVRRGTRLRAGLYGGHQQQGRRPGTEPVALTVGMACALDTACQDLAGRTSRVAELRRKLLAPLRRDAAPVVLNGPEEGGLPHTLNLSFPGLEADTLLMALDLSGVACSAGSACSSGSLLPSPVLRAMGVPEPVLRTYLLLAQAVATHRLRL
jgi:cysteine desulfurase